MSVVEDNNNPLFSIQGFHKIFSKKVYASWVELEDEIRQIKETKEKGDAFEQFCYFFLLYHKDLYHIEEVWSDKLPGREIPQKIKEKYKLEKSDYGVDGVSLLTSGDVEAWQAKFRSDQSAPTATELSTFWSESEYFDLKRTIANSSHLPTVASKKINHEQTLLDRLLELDELFFQTLFEVASHKIRQAELPKFTPRPHQRTMLNDVVEGLKVHERGKLIAACGTGKTLAALWVSESTELNTSKVLVFAPSISLVGQTVKEWVQHKNRDFDYLCVCSDKTITSDLGDDGEESDISINDLDFSVTTTPEEVARWIKSATSENQYIFSTYHSIPVIEDALKQLEGKFEFDLIIFDEAHRTVGREDQFFARGIKNENIPGKKRLFMTATERLVNPAVKTYAKNSGVEVFSMDDEEKYGPTLHNFNFGKAIKTGVIADYEVVLAVLDGDEERQLIEQNAYVYVDDQQQERVTLTAELLFKAAFLIKALVAEEVNKVIAFHSSRRNAVTFDRALDLIAESKTFGESTPVFTFVLGDQNNAERTVRISNFKNAERGVLGNVHVLSEGVDIPIVDSVYFVDPKKSLIDIVQGIGRALRKKPDTTKVAKVIVPVIIPKDINSLEDIDWDDTLATFHAVIQSMRDQDVDLKEEIDRFNEFVVSDGKRGRKITSTKNGKVRVITPGIKLPKGISLEDFLNKITLRVATANANPSGAKMGFSHLGKGERKSDYKPSFTILGDYNPDTFKNSLIMPTVKSFGPQDTKKRTEISINHNNVSHSIRLGVIEKIDNDNFKLTKLGKLLAKGEISFEDVFKNQMLLFSKNDFYPYRVLFTILRKLSSLNHFEFLFGPYVMQDSGDINKEIALAVERIEYLRENYPSLELTSLANRETLTKELNKISPVEISHNDIWGDRTTLKNKFRFIANHISLFDIFEPRKEGYKEPIKIKNSAKEDLDILLKKSNPENSIDPYGYWYWLK